jgi:hypothetical protein
MTAVAAMPRMGQATTTAKVRPVLLMSVPTRKAVESLRYTIGLRKGLPARPSEPPARFLRCAFSMAGRLPAETASRTPTAPRGSMAGAFRFAAATWRVPTISASRTRTARATCLANAAIPQPAARPTDACPTATAASMTTAARVATARPASLAAAASACARSCVRREPIAMRERPRCPVGAARAVAPDTSAIRPRTRARTIANARAKAPVPTSRPARGRASRAPPSRERGCRG